MADAPVCRFWGHDVALAAGDVLDEDYVQIVTTPAGDTRPAGEYVTCSAQQDRECDYSMY
ncbi:hypothetical protein GCM10023199_11290 [Actinomycetospora chibensis]